VYLYFKLCCYEYLCYVVSLKNWYWTLLLQVVLCCVYFQHLSHLLGSIEYTVSIIMLYFIPKAGNLELLRNKFASHCLYAVLEFNGSDYRYTELSYKITSLISRMCGLGSSGLTNM